MQNKVDILTSKSLLLQIYHKIQLLLDVKPEGTIWSSANPKLHQNHQYQQTVEFLVYVQQSGFDLVSPSFVQVHVHIL